MKELPFRPAGAGPVSGFALVTTLLAIALLTVIVVGIAVLMREGAASSAVARDIAVARQNAFLGLDLAVAELQRSAGPDTRVTASADILDKNNPPLTGVWKSWEGTDHETSGSFAGRPVKPDYTVKTKTVDQGGRFVTWLVSGADASARPDNPGTFVSATSNNETVPLLAAGTLGAASDREVHVRPQAVDQGSFAWWVSGENQKALLPVPFEPADQNSAAQWLDLAKSHAVPDPKPFGLDSVLTEPATASKALTLRTADSLPSSSGAKKPSEFFHDLSTSATGLLTNTATGGWRKDLSLLSESWGNQTTSGLPFFQITPTTSSSASRPTSDANSTSPGTMLYPWAQYWQFTPWYPATLVRGATASWANLVDWATSYKRITTSASGNPQTVVQSANVRRQAAYNFLHKSDVGPLIARVHWVFSYWAAPVASNPALLEPRLLMNTVFTLWNPYNVELAVPFPITITVADPHPFAFQYIINGAKNPNFNPVFFSSFYGNTTTFLVTCTYTLTDANPTVLKPGETRVYSPTTQTQMPTSYANAGAIGVAAAPGYRTDKGLWLAIPGPSNNTPLALPGNTTIQANAKFDVPIRATNETNGRPGAQVVLNYKAPTETAISPKVEYKSSYLTTIADAMYPALSGLASTTLSQAAGAPQPFLCATFGPRMASDTTMSSKGILQSSPFAVDSASGEESERAPQDSNLFGYLGLEHPVNAPFDFSFKAIASGGDSFLPNVDGATNRGYIMTGFSSADGLSRCAISELPTRPLSSLGELVNWDLRSKTNLVPPFAINLIGNSDATPLLPADSAVTSVSSKAGSPINLQSDDSYCANHLLFDDWFVSSIAPDPAGFGPTGGRTQKQVYTDFLSGNTSLANHAYRPISEDRAATDKNALYTQDVAPVDSWRKIASRLEVEGMFNVNSTSVTAWRALLGHARNQRVPYCLTNAATWSVGLSGANDYPWSRFSVAGDSLAGTPGSSGAFPEASQFTGYRTVDDACLNDLAEEIVNQVRLRGPFLSLAEFVNRQLSTGNLALAGTIQAALDNLSASSATDPFEVLKSLSQPTSSNPPSAGGVTADYQFPAAAAGYNFYGLPGWTRQADILRPLAPVLSARDDTFTIRAYGDARDKAGKIVARAWCEAVVRRTRDFVEPKTDTADTPVANLKSEANKTFGRRFQIVSFRWLSPDEV